MKIKGKDFIEGIKKAKGVVGEGDVIEHLRGFVFNPRENGLVDIAGSDGRMTLLAQIPYIETDNSDGSVLSLSSDKLQQLIKYIEKDSVVEIEYEEGKDRVTIHVDNYMLNTYKKEFENEFIKFDVIEERDFDDTVDTKEFTFILESLIKIARTESPDLEHQTVYIDEGKAHLFDGSIVAKIDFDTKQTYVIDYKSTKQILMLLKNTESEKVYLKYYKDRYTVLMRTDKDILTFRVFNPDVPDTSFTDDFNKEKGFIVDRLEVMNSVSRTQLATEEGEVVIHIDGDVLKLRGISEIEAAKDIVGIEDVSEDLRGVKFELMVNKFVDLCGTIRTKEVKVYIDLDGEMLWVEDTKGRAFGIMGVNID